MTAFGGQPFEIDLTAGYNPVRFPSINNQTCFNLFDFGGVMLPTAGYTQILSSLASKGGESRGIFYSDILKECVVVLGSVLYSITNTTHKVLGQLDSIQGKVYFAENGVTTLPNSTTGDPGGQIAVSDGQNIYIWGLDNSFIKAIDDQGNALEWTPGTLAFQSDFFFANDLNSKDIHISEINNARTWDADGISTISENTVTCAAFKSLLYVFGKDKTFLFYGNAQNEFFPYSQDTSRSWEYGCLSQGSLASSLGVMAWVGNSRYANPVILASTGGEPEAISTPGIDSIIDALSTPRDCEGFIYQEDGHTFYQLNFYTDEFSLLYDFTTKKWTRLTDFNINNVHPIRQTAYYEDKNELLGITRYGESVVNFGLNFFTNNGKIVPRTIITQNFDQKERNYIIQELDLAIEQGENQETSKICLSISKDNGRTFPIQRVFELGNIGHRKELLRWRKLGAARWWTFKYDFFSSDRFVILNSTGYIQK